MKIMKFLAFRFRIKKIIIIRIPYWNHENHENLIIPRQHYENHETHRIFYARIRNIMKI